MRGMWNGLCLLVALLILAGCRSTDQVLRPPKAPDELKGVPDDPRFEKPPQYPADAMKKDYNKKKDDGDANNPLNKNGVGAPRPGGL